MEHFIGIPPYKPHDELDRSTPSINALFKFLHLVLLLLYNINKLTN